MKKPYLLAAIVSLAFLFAATPALAATPMQRIQLMRYHLCLSNLTLGPGAHPTCAALLPR